MFSSCRTCHDSLVWREVKDSDFRPGFRIGALDIAILLAGGVLVLGSWSKQPLFSGIVAFSVGHFFLFCNVFRIRRSCELIWAAGFVVLCLINRWIGQPGWPVVFGISTVFSSLLIARSTRLIDYHGILWNRFNPGLEDWWNRQKSTDSEAVNGGRPVWSGEENGYEVTYDDVGVRGARPGGSVEAIDWRDLESIELVTNSLGPFATDVFWQIRGADRVIGFPMGARGEERILERFQELEGFDNESFIEAMGSTSDAVFLLWRRGES